MDTCFEQIVRHRLDELQLKPITAASKFGLPRHSIRDVLVGRTPSLKRAKEICQALGLEFHIGSPSQPSPKENFLPSNFTIATPETMPHCKVEVVGMAACGQDGWASLGQNDMTATLPDRSMSDRSFAVIAAGESMQPFGIFAGSVCYCDPEVPIDIGHFVFVERRLDDDKTAMTIKRVTMIGSGGDLELHGFLPPTEKAGALGNAAASQDGYNEVVSAKNIIRAAPVCWINTNPAL